MTYKIHHRTFCRHFFRVDKDGWHCQWAKAIHVHTFYPYNKKLWSSFWKKKQLHFDLVKYVAYFPKKYLYIYISIVCRMSWKDVLHLIIIQGTQKFEISILTITYYGQIKIQEICVLNAINVIKFHKKCLEKYNLWKEYQKLISLDAYMLFSRIPATLRSL